MTITRIRLQKDLEESLEEAVKRLQRSKNWQINQALREYLERDEMARQRWNETVEALKSVSEGETIPADKVHAWLESWGSDNELPTPKP
jgi:predicted transcriptional regulator